MKKNNKIKNKKLKRIIKEALFYHKNPEQEVYKEIFRQQNEKIDKLLEGKRSIIKFVLHRWKDPTRDYVLQCIDEYGGDDIIMYDYLDLKVEDLNKELQKEVEVLSTEIAKIEYPLLELAEEVKELCKEVKNEIKELKVKAKRNK